MGKWKDKVWHALQSYDTAVWVRAFGTALTSLTNFMMRPFLVFYLYDQLDGSIMLSMLVVGLSPLVGVLVNVLAGGISDRIGRKPVMLAALLIQAVSMLAFTAANQVWHFALISVLNGIGHALFGPAANAQVSDVVPEAKRPEVFALFHTALNIGAAVGPLIGVVLAAWNMHVVFLICAAAMSCYAAVVWWKVPETLPSEVKGRKSESPKRPFAGIRLRDHSPLLWLTLFACPVTLLYAQVESTFPLHLQTRFEDYKNVYASLMAFNGTMVILLQMWIARRTKDIPARKVMMFSYGMFALVSVGYGYAPWFVLLLAVEFVFTIGEMLNGPHMQKLVSVMAPPEHRGFYFSIYGMNWQLSRAVGPILGGFLLSRINGEFLFSLLTVVILAAGIAMSVLARRVEAAKAASELALAEEAKSGTSAAAATA
ncbi:MDR family MFS transporter [Gorillibacterium sp. sgz5001074]|uniref:MDR family MFS transporter n=1 Tax=Gorillibacterium sp. sgz5001074 TaxID=3446695 RepID=UPI003F678A95